MCTRHLFPRSFAPDPHVSGGILCAAVLGLFAAAGPLPLGGQTPGPADGAPARASDGRLDRVLLSNGTEYVGRIVDDGDPLRIELVDGEVVELPRDRVAAVRTVKGTLVGGELWPEDPNASRLFFTATGRNLAAGSGTFNAYYGLIPFVAVGITDRFTLAGGTPLFFGGDERLFYVAPKFQVVRAGRVQVGVGVLALHVTGGSEDGSYLAYGVATVGSTPHRGLTAGIGWGRSDGEWASRPALMLGGDHRASKRIKLITENYLIPDRDSNFGIVSAGIRIMGERLAADLALAAPIEGSVDFVFPMVNFSIGW